MAAAATSIDIPSFPTSDLFPSAFPLSQYGCANSVFASLGSQCAYTSIPSCAAIQATAMEANPTVTSVTFDAACCTSLSKYALSLNSCFSKNAPTCLDTSALLASATGAAAPNLGTSPPLTALLASATGAAAPNLGTASYSNPCAQYYGKDSGPTATPASSPKKSASSTTATKTSAGSSGGATNAAAAKGAAAPRMGGAGLKMYVGLGVVGALAVLSL